MYKKKKFVFFFKFLFSSKKHFVDLNDNRHLEENQASKQLRFDSVYLSKKDCALRSEIYKTAFGLFGEPVQSDFELIQEIEQTLLSLLQNITFESEIDLTFNEPV